MLKIHFTIYDISLVKNSFSKHQILKITTKFNICTYICMIINIFKSKDTKPFLLSFLSEVKT